VRPSWARKAERTKESGLAGMGGAAAASRNGGDPLSRGLRRGPGGGARASGPSPRGESNPPGAFLHAYFGPAASGRGCIRTRRGEGAGSCPADSFLDWVYSISRITMCRGQGRTRRRFCRVRPGDVPPFGQRRSPTMYLRPISFQPRGPPR
jgi:hypothetical protein